VIQFSIAHCGSALSGGSLKTASMSLAAPAAFPSGVKYGLPASSSWMVALI
jgi:hypothetical protein